MPTICTITRISLAFDGKPILDSLNANLPPGISGLVAPNGRGKSVLLNLLAGHRSPDGGCVEWHRPHYKLDQLTRLRGPRVADALDRNGRFDRELLECAGNLFELGESGLRQYGGNYSFYRQVRDAEVAGVEQRVEDARKEIQHTERQRQKALQRAAGRQRQGENQRGSQSKLLLDAGKDRAGQSLGKVKQQHARQQERLRQRLRKEQSTLEQQRAQQFTFTRDGLRGGPRLHLENLRLPYGHRKPISLTLHSGARWHVTGANGCGKSTLLKIINGALQPAAGECRRYGSCLYLDQEFSLLDGHSSALDNLLRLHPDKDSTYWRTALGSVRLRGDLALRPLNTLSGGKQLKVALLATTRGSRAPDLLLLDEPDNHLDLDSRLLLETALRDYPGSFLLVSHDPKFVEAVGVNGELTL